MLFVSNTASVSSDILCIWKFLEASEKIGSYPFKVSGILSSFVRWTMGLKVAWKTGSILINPLIFNNNDNNNNNIQVQQDMD